MESSDWIYPYLAFVKMAVVSKTRGNLTSFSASKICAKAAVIMQYEGMNASMIMILVRRVGTFRLVAQCLKQMRHRVALLKFYCYSF